MSVIARVTISGAGIVLAAATCLQAAPPGASSQASQSQASQSKMSQPSPTATAARRALLDTYCVTCHNERTKTAGLLLDHADVGNIPAGAAVWEKVVGKLRSGAMPPAGRPRPDAVTTTAFVSWLETELDRSASASPNPGRPAIHRLNRVEYTNAVRDLLGLDIDGSSLLPADEAGYGFDNNGDTLSLSPALMGRYMAAAQTVSRLAVGDPTMRSTQERVNFPRNQDARMSEDLPFGSRGGGVIPHYFPLDGDYVVKVRLRRVFNGRSAVFGADTREKLDVRLDGARLKLFEVGGECVGKMKEPRCARPDTTRALPSEYERSIDLPLEVRFPAKAGLRSIQVAFLQRLAVEMEGSGPSREPVGHGDDDIEDMMVDYLLIEGPINGKVPADTPSRRRIFVCRPGTGQTDTACATNILTSLARRAYRRPVTNRDVQPLLALYRAGRGSRGFEAGIQFAIEGLLVSPNFLARVERDPVVAAPRTAGRISDIELASRLSFFLWSSIPDDELLDAATRGTLSQPAVLERQVRRMLADPRSAMLVTNFAGQWLYLRNMHGVAPDPLLFPEFTDELRDAFVRETEMFIDSQIRDDHGVVDLLTANYTFVNEPLAKLYGIPNVYGTHFRRVTLTDENRYGLLGKAGILTVTSYATRTSPVLRGKYLLNNFLGAPPPPPPPNVNTNLTPKPGEADKSVRERLEEHRKNPVCANCHARMDPLGFALENFDGIGKWRTTDNHVPIDSAAKLPDGTAFNGPVEFRNVLLARRMEFVSTVADKLLTYALGRGTEYYDKPALRKIVRDAGPDYRWSALILGIVKSTPFQMRPAQRVSRENVSAQVQSPGPAKNVQASNVQARSIQ
jgi:mono/diheme cytochrome c family protein